MSIFSAIMLFAGLIFVHMIITEVFTVLFRLTGMTDEKARFQVVSMLTNSGYTTNESETVTSSRIRRRLATGTMIFGYAFTVTIVSSVVNIFLALNTFEVTHLLTSLPIPTLIACLLLLLVRNKWFKALVDKGIERVATRLIFKGKLNHITMLDSYGDRIIAQAHLNKIPCSLREKPLHTLGLSDIHDVLVLLRKPLKEEFDSVTANTIFRDGDILIVIGKAQTISTLFEVESGYCPMTQD